MAALASADRVLRYDTRCHGKSEHPPGGQVLALCHPARLQALVLAETTSGQHATPQSIQDERIRVLMPTLTSWRRWPP
jgi:hypothetical protein